jgi:hypothetical protein
MAPGRREGAPYGRRIAPHDGALVSMTAAPELLDPRPIAPFPRWVRPLADYERRETTIVEGLRYG